MPRLIALESDSREARIVVARTRGKKVVIENAIAVELVARAEGGGDNESAVNAANAQKLGQAIASLGVGRVPALVAVGRSSVELRQLSLPPSPPEELPELVRFQALRQFSNIGEDWPLDYATMPSADGESISLLAAVVTPQVVKQIRDRCLASGLTAEHVVLRPFAAAALLRRESPDSACRMMVDVATDEADLTILSNDQVVFMRTVRLPHETDLDAQYRALTGEIRRTIVAAQNQLGGKRVEKIVICDDGGEKSSLKASLVEAVSLPVELLNPFQSTSAEYESGFSIPKAAGRFTALVGMLVVEADGQAHDINFLHPKRRPVPPSRRRQLTLMGATAATIVLAIGYYIWNGLSSLDDQIDSAKTKLTGLGQKEKEANARLTDLGHIEKFMARDVSVLDELGAICETLPPAEKAIVGRLTFNTDQAEKSGNRGRFLISGNVAESTLIKQFEDAMRDKQHQPKGGQRNTDPNEKKLPWKFSEEIVLVDPEAAKPVVGKSNTSRDSQKTNQSSKKSPKS